MTKRRKIDASKVIEAVESGRLSQEVMDSYGLEKASPQTKSGRKRSDAAGITEIGPPLGDVTISKRGSLVLPKSIVQQLGYGLETTFVARKTKAGIILKPV